MIPQTNDAKPAVWDSLSVILPTPQHTLFLRACLQSGEIARQAWEQWQAQTGGLQPYLTHEVNAAKWLLPLLYWSLRRNEVAIDSEILPLLKNAYVREQLRYEDYLGILTDTLAVLNAGGVRAIVLKGAALGETAYPEPALRHSHDIDLLIEPRDLESGVSLLLSSGLRPLSHANRKLPHVVLCHSSGLAIGLFPGLFQVPYYTLVEGDREQSIWPYSLGHNFGGAEASILSPAASLWEVLGHDSYSPNRRSLKWVCDAWFLIEDKAGPDWNLFTDLAGRSNLALPLAVMLSYLAQSLKATIPPAVLERLRTMATRTEPLGYEIALAGAHKTANGTLRNMMGKSRGLRERLIILNWVFFPSARYLKMMQDVRHPRLMPLYYLLRPFRNLMRERQRDKKNIRVESA